MPALVIEESGRNRPRSEPAVTTSMLDRLRQLRLELREYAGDQHEHIWLAETAQHIPLVTATAPQNFREAGELLPDGMILEPAEPEYTRAVQRGLNKRAPFTVDKNSVAGALHIETYASQVCGADGSDVYAFVTSNYRDFSVPNRDRRRSVTSAGLVWVICLAAAWQGRCMPALRVPPGTPTPPIRWATGGPVKPVAG